MDAMMESELFANQGDHFLSSKDLPIHILVVKKIQDMANSFLSSLPSTYPRNKVFTTIIIFFVGLIFFASLSPNALINGDSAVYEEQIQNLDFTQRTIHIGYYLLATPFIHLLPGQRDFVFNFVNCFFGGLSLVVIYLIGSTIYQKQKIALLSVLFVLTNYMIVNNFVYAEVYGVQTFFLLISFYLWLKNKPIPTGLAFSMAILISPSSILATPFYMLFRPFKRDLINFFIPVFIVLGLVVVPNRDDFLFGGRGLLLARASQVNIVIAALKEIYEIYFGMFMVLPLVITGIVAIIQEYRLRIFFLSLMILWFSSFIFGERFADVPVQLLTYALLCIVAAKGYGILTTIVSRKEKILFLWLPVLISLLILLIADLAIRARLVTIAEVSISKKIWIANLFVLALFIFVGLLRNQKERNKLSVLLLLCILIFNGFWLFKLVTLKNSILIEYKKTVLELSEISKPDYIVVGSWDQGILFEHYVFQRTYTDRWISTELLYGEPGIQASSPLVVARWKDTMAQERDIWILNYDLRVFSDLQNEGYVIEPYKTIWRAQVSKSGNTIIYTYSVYGIILSDAFFSGKKKF